MNAQNRRWMLVAGASLVVCVAAAGWTLIDSDSQGQPTTPEDRVDRLGDEKTEQARRELIQLTASPTREIALSAVRNLGRHGDEESRRALEEVLADTGRDPRVRSAAAAKLGEYDQADPQTLARVLAREKNVHIRRGAARGLMKWTDTDHTEAVGDLYRALSDPDLRVRQSAATGLRRATLMLFTFDPRKDPRTQRKQLAAIRRFLCEKGHME